MSSDVPAVDYRALLDEERGHLVAQLEEMGFADGGTGLDYDSNFADSSQVTAERGEVEALSNKLKEQLADVDTALAKLDDGTFGACDSCGNPIDPARLEAMPAAKLCMDCASKR